MFVVFNWVLDHQFRYVGLVYIPVPEWAQM